MKAREENSWKTIREEVFRRINDKVWLPGDRIPGEAELAAEFGCARTTVHRALRDLADAGIVTRRRKAGTRVSLHPVRKATLAVPVTRNEVERRGGVYSYALLEMGKKKLPPPLRGQMDLPDNRLLLFTRTVHFADARPYIYEERYTNTDAVPDILDADLEAISVNEWLVENAPYSHGNLVFSAINASPVMAEALATEEGAALFLAERTTWIGVKPITYVQMIYAPGYRMVSTI